MRYTYYYLITVIVLILDYVTKKIVATKMNLYDEISVIGNFFLITSHRNRGAAFGILEGQRVFFIIITVAIVSGLIWYTHTMRKTGKPRLFIGLTLVLGGAIGNFIDRVRFGEVVDFFKFNFGSYTFPIFNIADSAIVIGVGLILLDALLSAREEKLAQGQDNKEPSEHEQQPTAR
ncbi:lipoprotein signal peptidase [Paenibacillus sp. 1011MAR3C5]|uniref:signal peptidase II n=1 Tax=Paenibacillus sp. 1011MAR3C5 TaxID=1675787 RepID=UPI000E6C3359|nr:signal peptidase II [Paenibacillus sp. 1011MAR3C5]RJE90749.1 lipoprotein signal peptidase [Paenibacillus sp. 1011MAR3C5]